MGIQLHGILLIDKTLGSLKKDRSQTQIVDWGNSYIKPSAIKWIKENNPQFSDYEKTKIRMPESHSEAWVAGDFLKLLGYKYLAIDLNGKEDSLPIDLREDITHYPNKKLTHLTSIQNFVHNAKKSSDNVALEKIINYADFIIDCGTSEHVDNQYHNWKNQFNMLKEGGISLNILPAKGYWDIHCKYKYTIEFFQQFIELCNYETTILGYTEPIENRMDIVCTLRKTSNSKFPTEEEFNKLPIHIEEGVAFNDRVLYTYAYDSKQMLELQQFVKDQGGNYKGITNLTSNEATAWRKQQLNENYK